MLRGTTSNPSSHSSIQAKVEEGHDIEAGVVLDTLFANSLKPLVSTRRLTNCPKLWPALQEHSPISLLSNQHSHIRPQCLLLDSQSQHQPCSQPRMDNPFYSRRHSHRIRRIPPRLRLYLQHIRHHLSKSKSRLLIYKQPLRRLQPRWSKLWQQSRTKQKQQWEQHRKWARSRKQR